VLAAAVIMVLSMALPAVSAGLAVAGAHAASGSAATVPAAASVPTTASVTQTPAIPTSPHPGTLDVYTIAPGGATTMDPAVAYDTVSYEPILNVYQTLVNYNGSNTATFVPTLATCVPGTQQCVTDYGTNLTGYVGSQPIYWTFVIDPVAQFYDPSTGNHWGVYPSDVMFSIARTLAYSEAPAVGATNGWMDAQALLPAGNGSWDHGYHAPYNNTPLRVLSSMFVNDTSFCPSAALASGQHGCITFVANGSNVDWPFFLDLIADNLGSSVEPCGWFTAQGAAIPGWPGSAAPQGDGPCLLPGGAHNTADASFQSFLSNPATGSNGTYWDSIESLQFCPADCPPGSNTGHEMVGSGAYYASVTLSSGYSLFTNPSYAQPSGCNPTSGLAIYSGYCDPAPLSYQGSVHVTYQDSGSTSISGFQAGNLDLGAFAQQDTSSILNLQSHGKLGVTYSPTLSILFFPYNLNASASAFRADGFAGPYTIPADFFSSNSARMLFDYAYPYAVVGPDLNAVDGLQWVVNTGGPIPQHMGGYYPTNVSFPNAKPDLNPADVGGAAWWANQAMNITGSPYYDPELAQCKNVTCVFPIEGELGADALNSAIQLWIHSVELLTDEAIQPYWFGDECGFIECIQPLFPGPGQNPFPIWSSGWAPDYPDPTDYITPMALPNQTYTYPDAVYQQLSLPAYDNALACGHATDTYANLIYWSHQAQLTSECQGVAYGDSVAYMEIAAGLPTATQRILDYNLVEHILNALGLYTYFGQENAIGAAAPWINNATLNTDPMIGGGGDQPYFQIHDVGVPASVKFTESGLHAGTSWSVTVDGVGTGTTTATSMTWTNVTVGTTYTYVINVVGGYYPYVAPNIHTAVYSGSFTATATLKTIATHWRVYAGYSITFNPNTAFSSGLPPNFHWKVVVAGAPAGTSLTGSSITISGLANGTHHYTVVATGFGLNGQTKTGILTLAGTSVTFDAVVFTGTPPVVNLLFTQGTYALTFNEVGIGAGDQWSVTVSTTSAYVCAAGSCALYATNMQMTTGTSIVFSGLPNGTYQYSVSTVALFHPTVASGNLVIHSHPLIHVVHFAAGLLHVESPAKILAPAALGQRSRESP
jgi:hypothetical protein